MQVVQVQKAEATGTYIIRGSKGELCAIDTSLFKDDADLIANIETGKVGDVAGQTIELVEKLFGPETIAGLSAEVEALTDLETVYQA